VNFEAELRRAEKKIDCGAEMLFTQPLFSDESIEKYLLAKKRLNCKIIAGIMPPVGYKNALFLNNEVPGIKIPDDVVAKLKECAAEDAKAVCTSYIKDIIDKIHNNCDGYYLMTQLKAVDYSVDIVKYIRSKNNDSEVTK
jgi:homocysteine S-methyltransferase